MTRLCRPLEGWSVTISRMECSGIGFGPLERDCLYSACVLKDDAPDLYESFSVQIYPVSHSQVKVETNHSISYSLKNEPDVPCGE
jgi:hypothetical protein